MVFLISSEGSMMQRRSRTAVLENRTLDGLVYFPCSPSQSTGPEAARLTTRSYKGLRRSEQP